MIGPDGPSSTHAAHPECVVHAEAAGSVVAETHAPSEAGIVNGDQYVAHSTIGDPHSGIGGPHSGIGEKNRVDGLWHAVRVDLRCAVALALVATACAPEAIGGTQVREDFSRGGSFFAAPFPSDDLLRASGHVDLSGFPNPRDNPILDHALALLTRDARGFSVAGGVFFALTDAIEPASLPTPGESRAMSANVFLVAVDRASPDFGRPTPIDVSFSADGGPFGAPNLLALVPVQGIPLRPKTTYAAVVRRSMKDAHGARLGMSLSTAQLVGGVKPDGLSGQAFATYQRAIDALSALHVDGSEVAGLAVFTTDDPASTLAPFVAAARGLPVPVPATFTADEVFSDFCVFHSSVSMPDYQRGTPPFTNAGGDFELDSTGAPKLQRHETANVWVTLPRARMPAAGFPTVVLIGTGAGGTRALVDRGVQAQTGGPAITPGTGPAMEFAKVGFAGITVDGPLEGTRNPNGENEDLLIFNFENAPALRDNIRESALELALLPAMLKRLSFDASSCPGLDAGGELRFDTTHLALFGHSMGASIAPLALAEAPEFRAAILSGAGASWLDNVVYKEQPLPIAPLAEALLDYPPDEHVSVHDPVVSLVQWAVEPADSQVYARALVREVPRGQSPRNVLMLQGIVDHYILPNIADAVSVPLGLSLVGPALDAKADLPGERTFVQVDALAPRFTPPAGTVDALEQFPSDGVEDGHEVVFQTEPPKAAYRCFLASFAKDEPSLDCP